MITVIICLISYALGFMMGYYLGQYHKKKRQQASTISAWPEYKSKEAMVVDLEDPLDIDLGEDK